MIIERYMINTGSVYQVTFFPNSIFQILDIQLIISWLWYLKYINIRLNPFGTPFGAPGATKLPKREKQLDAILKPYQVEMSQEIMPFDTPNLNFL